MEEIRKQGSCSARLSLILNQRLTGAGIDDLAEVDAGQEVAHGVWKVDVGDTAKISRYTDFAAVPPQLQQIDSPLENKLFQRTLAVRMEVPRCTERMIVATTRAAICKMWWRVTTCIAVEGLIGVSLPD